MSNSTNNNPEERAAQRLADLLGEQVAGKAPGYPPVNEATDLNTYPSTDMPLDYIENELLNEKNDHEACYSIIGYAYNNPEEIRDLADRLQEPFFRGRLFYSFVFSELIREVQESGYINPNNIRDKIAKRFPGNSKSDIKVFIDMMHRKPTKKLLDAAIQLINQGEE